LGLNRKLTPWTSISALAVIAVISFGFAACSRATFRPDPVFMERVCTADDLEGTYVQQTSGALSPENLAALSDDPGRRREDLEAAGLQSGHFVYWKEVVGRPPVPPHVEILCQMLLFESEAQASSFVEELRPEPETLATVALTWLPTEGRAAGEVTNPPVDLPRGSRMFEMQAGEQGNLVRLFVVVTANGSQVHSTYMGSRNGSVSADDAVAVHARMLARNQRDSGAGR